MALQNIARLLVLLLAMSVCVCGCGTVPTSEGPKLQRIDASKQCWRESTFRLQEVEPGGSMKDVPSDTVAAVIRNLKSLPGVGQARSSDNIVSVVYDRHQTTFATCKQLEFSWKVKFVDNVDRSIDWQDAQAFIDQAAAVDQASAVERFALAKTAAKTPPAVGLNDPGPGLMSLIGLPAPVPVSNPSQQLHLQPAVTVRPIYLDHPEYFRPKIDTSQCRPSFQLPTHYDPRLHYYHRY